MSQTLSIPFNRLPLGFRFHPTDQELINHYLKRKISGQINPVDAAVIPEIDVCRFEPWDLPSKSVIRSDDAEWFFLAPVDRKYPLGNRSNRATAAGNWKATGKDRFIRSRTGGGEVVVGMKKTLVFHKGRAPRGKRSCWIMHEYRTVEPEFEEGGFVLCRLFKKPKETVPAKIPPQLVGTGFSPTPANSSPSNTLRREDVFEGEFSTPLHQKSPELQSLPSTCNNQLTDIPANSCPTNTLSVDVFEGEFATPPNQKSPESSMVEELKSLLDPSNNQSTDIPANSCPTNALSIDVFEGEFATPPRQKPPESSMVEELQSLLDPSNNQLTDILANSCPTNALHVDVFEGEFATPLNQKSPESCMVEELQSLLKPSNNQLTESKLAEKACYQKKAIPTAIQLQIRVAMTLKMLWQRILLCMMSSCHS